MSDENTENALSPDQLEPNDDQVRPLDENRYVVDPDGTDNSHSVTDAGDSPVADRTNGDTTEEFAALDGAYALEIRAQFGTERNTLAVETNDVSEAFESLLHWYAGHLAEDTPPEDVLAVLLANSTLEVDI